MAFKAFLPESGWEAPGVAGGVRLAEVVEWCFYDVEYEVCGVFYVVSGTHGDAEFCACESEVAEHLS